MKCCKQKIFWNNFQNSEKILINYIKRKKKLLNTDKNEFPSSPTPDSTTITLINLRYFKRKTHYECLLKLLQVGHHESGNKCLVADK